MAKRGVFKDEADADYLIDNSGDGVEFLKKEQFTAGLIPTLRLKVESGDLVTYHDAERRAYQKYRKLKCLEEEPLPVLRPREVPIQVSNIAPIPVVPMAAGPSTQPAMIDNEVLERLNESLTNLSIHLAQGVGSRGTIPRSPQERPIRPRRVLTCWNCGEEGHGINNCPYPRGGYGQPPQQLPYPRNHANDPPPRGPITILQRPNPPLAPIREEAPIPPLPDPGVHVVKVASVRPPAYVEALANGIKQTRGKEKEDTMREDSIPSGREHKREKGETSKRRRRRCINLHDFPLGHGMSPYNLIEDLQAKGPSISWPQFFALCPQVRREMAKAISTRIPKKKGNVVRIAPVEMEDIVPTIDCFIKGTLVQKGLVDGGAQICIMTEATIHGLNLKIHKTREVRDWLLVNLWLETAVTETVIFWLLLSGSGLLVSKFRFRTGVNLCWLVSGSGSDSKSLLVSPVSGSGSDSKSLLVLVSPVSGSGSDSKSLLVSPVSG
ncbi:hypothetical protein L7F22_011117 [Adiantum nelumboides]|nr:hypothetical protein [Adiantum nelumboides]